MPSNVVQRYVDALKSFDLAALTEVVHPDITVHYPQSGETIRGKAQYLNMIRDYPGGVAPRQQLEKTHGAEETVHVASPLPFGLPSVTVAGATDTFTCQTLISYPDGSEWHGVLILRIVEGKVIEDTSYFAQPFDAPAWRAKYCEARG